MRDSTIKLVIIVAFTCVTAYLATAVYDPVAGRWTQRDPVGYADSPNLYQFNGNDPVNSIDYLGLFKWDDDGNIKVEKGDTLSQISSYTGIPQSVLRSANSDRDLIKVGQTIRLPEANRVRPGESYEVTDVKVTAYCSCAQCCNKASGAGDGVTASGSKASEGTLAVDPKAIPMGSSIAIKTANGTTISGTAKDTGGTVKGKHIDVWLADHQAAKNFGVKTATITITRPTK